jgi:hypothetical protein
MRSSPTDHEKRFYADNGFVAIDPYLSPGEVETWRPVVDSAVASRGEQRFSILVEEGPGRLWCDNRRRTRSTTTGYSLSG